MVYLFLEPPEYSFINDTQEREDWGGGLRELLHSKENDWLQLGPQTLPVT